MQVFWFHLCGKMTIFTPQIERARKLVFPSTKIRIEILREVGRGLGSAA